MDFAMLNIDNEMAFYMIDRVQNEFCIELYYYVTMIIMAALLFWHRNVIIKIGITFIVIATILMMLSDDSIDYQLMRIEIYSNDLLEAIYLIIASIGIILMYQHRKVVVILYIATLLGNIVYILLK